jgi:hypothetical protein
VLLVCSEDILLNWKNCLAEAQMNHFLALRALCENKLVDLQSRGEVHFGRRGGDDALSRRHGRFTNGFAADWKFRNFDIQFKYDGLMGGGWIDSNIMLPASYIPRQPVLIVGNYVIFKIMGDLSSPNSFDLGRRMGCGLAAPDKIWRGTAREQ